MGAYEITAKLGEGGMGEVYRATDGKLKREVAIKVLPAGVAEDPERLARFEREAQMLAQLHHPHIASIFGLEESGGVKALVMELVEGPTLADRLAAGRPAVEESLSIARQIALALEAAHGKGIIHRDLKPQNVKLTEDAEVKVLDFGLAKALETPGAAASATVSPTLLNSPTLTAAGTQLGVILGTAAYMAPEQARGAAVDKRADIWAFGVVLWEMLTGASLFAADTVTDTLAGVLKTDIDLTDLPAETPAAIRRLLRRCLERDPRNRLHDIADARLVLDDVLAGRTGDADEEVPERQARMRWPVVLPWVVAAVLGALLLLRPGAPRNEATAPRPRLALEIALPPGQVLTDSSSSLALAPDGSAVVLSATDPVRGSQLWLRRLGDFDMAALRGTESGAMPFWSPDSRSIGFFRTSDGALCRYDLATGGVEVLALVGAGSTSTGVALVRGGSWAADGTIVFAATANGPIQRLTPAGAVEDVTVLDPSILDGSHRFPSFLPDGKHFVLNTWSNNRDTQEQVGGVYLASLEHGIERRLTRDASQALVAGPDRLVVRRGGALTALTLDPGTLEVTGSSSRIADAPLFWAASGGLFASATQAGDLAYLLDTGVGGGRIVWLGRDGTEIGSVDDDRPNIDALALPPNGRNYAVGGHGAGGSDIWVADEKRGVVDRLTPEGIDSTDPVWSPDGRRLAYVNEAAGSLGVYVREADGSREAELLLSDAQRDFVTSSWSPDGKYLLLDSNAKGEFRTELWLYDVQQGAARELLSDASASLREGVLSSDGGWLAYVSDETGNPEVFVRPFPALDRRWKVSQGGATSPHWRRDGRELLFESQADGAIQAVDLAPSPDGLDAGAPHTLFAPRPRLLALAPAPDHDRFLAGVLPADARQEPIRVILGWRSGLETGGSR
ncbi:MAG: protein kinase [Thermoanaerobaculia bacterium]